MSNKSNIYFDLKMFFYLFLGFIVATVAGTLSHECGHWAVGRCFGWHPRINYKYTSSGSDVEYSRLIRIDSQYRYEIRNNLVFPGQKQYKKLQSTMQRQWLLFIAGGPLETILTGTLGLFLLFFFRKQYIGKKQLLLFQWIVVFLSLFWLREIFNLLTAIFISISGRQNINGDEFTLARGLSWNQWSIPILLGILSLFVSVSVIFIFIPLKQRYTFILAGLAGGLTGAYLWLILLGPKLMP